MSKNPRRWFRYSLRTMFALCAAVATVAALGIVVRDHWVDVAFPVAMFLFFLALATPILAVMAVMVGSLLLILIDPYRHVRGESESRAKHS